MATKKKRLGAQLDTDTSSQASWIRDTGKKAPKGTYHYTGGQTREVAGRAAEKARYPKKISTGTQAEYRASMQGSARSGYAKKLKTQELRGKSQISYKKPNTTMLSTPAMSSGYTQKVASKAYLNTARNGGEEGKENAQNRTGRIAKNNTYTSFVKSRTGKSPRLSGRGKRITSANKALLDRYNRGK